MKKVLRLTAALAFMFVTSKGMANEPKLNVVAKSNTKSLVFELDGSAKETSLKFMDVNGNVMYSEAVSGKEKYVKKFDLRKLVKGSYFLKVNNTLKEIVYTVNVDSDNVAIVEKKENVKPVFRTENAMVYLNLLNLSKDKVEIKVLDSENRLVFESEVTNELKIEKAFNFTKAYKDSYTVMVKNSNGVYVEDILIN